MRDSVVAVGSVIFVFGCLIAAAFVQKSHETPPIVTPRILDCDPDFYLDRVVSVRTDGMEPGDSASVVIYRKQADSPPCVLIRLKHPCPNPLPKYLTGTVIGRKGTTVIVIE